MVVVSEEKERERGKEKEEVEFFRRPFFFFSSKVIKTKRDTHPLADHGPSEDNRHVDRVPPHQELSMCVK